MNIKKNLSNILSELPGNVKLVAVSKFHPVEMIKEAYDTGQFIFGESRVQELTSKQPLLPKDIKWHFIGTLQTNKVKYIAPFISMIQSVDSLKLLNEINKQAKKYERTIRVLIEVHIAKESSKHGFSVEECKTHFTNGDFTQFSNIEFCGLMGMSTFTNDIDMIRKEFRALHYLFKEIQSMQGINNSIFNEISMGMSNDYKIAIEEGSTMIRIGTEIFGTR